MKRKKDILDMLPLEAIKKVDDIGYGFLAEHGYDVKGVTDSRKKRRKLKAELRANSQTLRYSVIYGKDNESAVLFFILENAKGEIVARSKSMKFVFKREERDGEKKG